ncbi:MAG: DUF433 domain-containing protein [Anaerolineae bacterium]
MIIGSLADGMSYGQIRQAYPQLSDEDILASLAYAADVLPSYRLASSANQ